MKSLLAVICLLTGASLLTAETTPAKTTTPPKSTVPAKPGTKAKVEVSKPKEEEPTIPGQTIVRANGTFLGLEVVDGNFKLSFYDSKKKPMAIDVTRASARWPNVRGPGDNRTVLNPSGNALVGAKPVIPPYNFNVFITLLQGDGDESKAVETLVVQFRG